MSASAINSFLNGFSDSCISQNSGFAAKKPTGYSPSGGFTYSSSYVTAGTVIAAAAQAYGLNPKVIITTLEKEQSLVTGRNDFDGYCKGGEHKYAAAMGYGCPDSGTTHSYTGVSLYRRNTSYHTSTGSTCVNKKEKAGFSQQVIRAAWLLKFGQQRSLGHVDWAVVSGNWNNSDDPPTYYGGPMTQGNMKRCQTCSTKYYDGYTTIDSTATHMDSGATAALYWYTPHFHGNQVFVSVFEGWFGSTKTTTKYAWGYGGQQLYTDSGRTQTFSSAATLQPGEKTYVRFYAVNKGTTAWSNTEVRVGTSRSRDRTSVFQDGTWLSAARPAALTEATVNPGETGTFEFIMKAPSTPGSYNEYFNLVVEHKAWMKDIGLYFHVNVVEAVAPDNTTNARLNGGESLTSDEFLLSPDKNSTLTINGGKLNLTTNFKTVWTAPGSGGVTLNMQSDGNLVLRNSSNAAVWNAGTVGHPGAYLLLKSDGNLVVNDSGNTELWTSDTTHYLSLLAYVNRTLRDSKLYPDQLLSTTTRNYKLTLQGDGNLVLRSASNKAVWSSGTFGYPGATLKVQGDGNMVIRNESGAAVWSTKTSSGDGTYLRIQTDGNLVLRSKSGAAVWNTHTAGL